MAVGILVIMEAKPGKGEDLGEFLRSGRDLVAEEQLTVTWHSFKIDENTYGIFDTFEGEEGRQAHVDGPLADRLRANGADFLAAAPDVKYVDVIAVK